MQRREFLKRCFGAFAALFVVTKRVVAAPEPIEEILDWKIPKPTTLTCTKPYPPGFHTVPIEYIKIDPAFDVRDRSNYDLGPLYESIKKDGLRHPIVIKGDGKLIDGVFRYDALKKLGYKEVPVQVLPHLMPHQERILAWASKPIYF